MIPKKPIGEITKPKQWRNLPISKLSESGFSVYGANGIIGFYNEYNHEHPTIAITCRGATCGNIHVTVPKSYITSNAMALDHLDTDECDLNYLAKYLQFRGLEDVTTGAAQPQITRTNLERVKIPLPHMEDQIRIAHLLGKVEALISQRKQSLQQLDELLKSVFLDMFGPTNSAFEKWPLVEIKSLAAKHKGAMRTGPFGSNLLHSEFVEDGEVAVLGIDNAVQNHFAWGKRRFITNEKYKDLESYRIFPGDVIVTIMGTIGRSAVIPDDIPVAINTKHLAAITLDRKIANPLFLSYSIHSSPYILNQFKSKNRGAIMSGLNLTLIKETKLRRPPIKLQNQFAVIHERVNDIKAKYHQSLSELVNLYGALSQKAFKGELNLSRVLLEREIQTVTVTSEVLQTDESNLMEAFDKLDEYPMDTSEGRKKIFKKFFDEDIASIEVGSDFSVNAFWESAQFRAQDYTGEEPQKFGLSEYDCLKEWVFELLGSGQLEQSFDEADNQIVLKAKS